MYSIDLDDHALFIEGSLSCDVSDSLIQLRSDPVLDETIMQITIALVMNAFVPTYCLFCFVIFFLFVYTSGFTINVV